MEFKIGDRVIYEGSEGNGENLRGEVVAFCKNTTDMITIYLAELDSGIYVHFTPHNLRWRKVEEPVLLLYAT